MYCSVIFFFPTVKQMTRNKTFLQGGQCNCYQLILLSTNVKMLASKVSERFLHNLFYVQPLAG